MNVPEDPVQSQRMTDAEVKAVIRLWSERNKEPEKPVDSRPSVADVSAALDIPAEDAFALLKTVREQRSADERLKSESERRRIQEQARIAREKQRLDEARRKREDEQRHKAMAPGISITPISTVPASLPQILGPPRRPAVPANLPIIFAAVAALAMVVLIGWLLSPPRVMIQSSVNIGTPPAFAVPAFTPPPMELVMPPTPPVPLTPAPSFGLRPDPLQDAQLRMERIRADSAARRMESELRMQEKRAQSDAMRAQADALREESRQRMDESMARARALSGAPFGIPRTGTAP